MRFMRSVQAILVTQRIPDMPDARPMPAGVARFVLPSLPCWIPARCSTAVRSSMRSQDCGRRPPDGAEVPRFPSAPRKGPSPPGNPSIVWQIRQSSGRPVNRRESRQSPGRRANRRESRQSPGKPPTARKARQSSGSPANRRKNPSTTGKTRAASIMPCPKGICPGQRRGLSVDVSTISANFRLCASSSPFLLMMMRYRPPWAFPSSSGKT